MNTLIAAEQPSYAPMRPAVASVLSQAADADPRLVVLGADGHALAAGVRERHPEQYVDVGIAEANLVGVASGLARAGRRVVVCAMAPFLVRRAAEQIRNDVCNAGLDVTFVGVGGGLGYGTLGPTHHCPEDLGFFSALPHTRVYCPADAIDATWAVSDALAGPGPAYVRLGAREDRIVHSPETSFDPAAGLVMRPPGDALAVTAGIGVGIALDAADRLTAAGHRLGVLALTTVKPFPREQLLDLAAGVGTVLTVEEHLEAGGIGASAARALAGRWTGRFATFAVAEDYPPVGDRGELLAHYGITTDQVVSSLADTDHTRG